MDRYELGRLAREAGVNVGSKTADALSKFAGLVADKEREACAKRLNDRAEQFRTKEFPHMYEEKAQILDYAADLVRSN